MNITRIHAYSKDLGLTRPYAISYKTTSEVVNVFLEIELENGMIGLGAAAPSVHVFNESVEDSLSNLQSDKLQQWIGRDIRHFRSMIAESFQLFPHHSATRTAIDIALHDAFGKFLGIPVMDMYGRKHESFPTSITIGISSLEETLAEAQDFKDRGFKILKIKVGNNVEEDIERCAKIRERFGNHFMIRVDANQGYDAAQTLRFYQATIPLGLELIEQPMPVGTEDELRALPKEVRACIACDESLKDARSALLLAAPPQACGIFNIKLMKCSGLLGAFEIAAIAQAADIDLFWGCYSESAVGVTAALHAALTCRSTRYLDLDGSLFLADDAIKPGFTIEHGMMIPLGGPGFGFQRQ